MENVKEKVKEVVKQFTKEYVGEVVKESTKKLVKGLAKEKKVVIENELKNKSAEEIERYFVTKDEFNTALDGTVNSVKEASLEKIQLSFEKHFTGVLRQAPLSLAGRTVRWLKYPLHAGMVVVTMIAITYAIFLALPNPPPETPSLIGPSSGVVGTAYDFSASAVDPEHEKIRYTFDWGDGSETTTGLVTSGFAVDASHIWNTKGNYIIKVIAIDDRDAISGWSNSIQVTIADLITATAHGPFSGTVKNPISFAGSASGGIPPYSYAWDFGDGASSDQQNPTHAYSSAGTYTAIFTVTDNIKRTSQDSAQVNVASQLIAMANVPYSGTVNTPMSFAASASGGTPPYSYVWDFGDGASSDQQNPTHSYSSAGTYTAILTVTDRAEITARKIAQVTVSAVAYTKYNVFAEKGLIVQAGLCDNGVKNCMTQGNVTGGGYYGMVGTQVALNGNASKLANIVINHGTAISDHKNLTVGESWDVGDGWVITAISIDARASPRIVWLMLSKDGAKKDEKVVQQGAVYTYVEKSIGGESDVPLLVTYIDSVIAGATTDMVRLRYTFAISSNVIIQP